MAQQNKPTPTPAKVEVKPNIQDSVHTSPANVDEIVTPPMVSSPEVPEVKQVYVPNYNDAPDSLKKRFMRLDAPMGHGPSLKSPVDPLYQKECREYLIKNGWEELSPDLWRDPLTGGGQRGEKQVVRMLLGKDKKTEEPLMQMVMPPAYRPIYTTEAIAIQRCRDAEEEGRINPSPLERLDRAAEKIVALEQHQIKVAQDLAQVSQRPIPNNLDALKAEVVMLRRMLLNGATRLKQGPSPVTEAA